jgi:hypothetical protein
MVYANGMNLREMAAANPASRKCARFAPSIGISVQVAMPIHTAPSLLTRHFTSMLIDAVREQKRAGENGD